MSESQIVEVHTVQWKLIVVINRLSYYVVIVNHFKTSTGVMAESRDYRED